MAGARIGLAGFQHETNTFAQSRAGMAEFEAADSWPGMLTGAAVISQTRAMNLPIAGAAEAGEKAGFELVPILWCAAEPSGFVRDAAFEAIAQRIVEGAQGAGLGGLYLDLHGAMVTESHPDGEGELLRRLRAALGPDLPIAVSLDLHANVSRKMVDLADVITIYRSYPHLDMGETGARAMGHLRRLLAGERYVPAFWQADFLVPLHAQCTDASPAQELYGLVCAQNESGFAELALGFTAADVPDCGPSVLAYGRDGAGAEAMAAALAEALEGARGGFDTRLYGPEEAIAEAADAAGPMVLADVQDNPGAGGGSDTTGLLRALVEAGAKDAVLGLICDPAMATRACGLGVGARFEAGLGAPLFHGGFEVQAVSEGPIAYTGRMYGGGVASPGKSCLLLCRDNGADVRIVVTSQRIQCLDQALFRHFGVVLEACRLICVKSTVHFRDDFDGLAARVLSVAAPGAFPCAIDLGAYRNLRAGMGVAGA